MPVKPTILEEWFGQDKRRWIILPRALLEDMPKRWQRKFVRIMNEIEKEYEDLKPIGSPLTARLPNSIVLKSRMLIRKVFARDGGPKAPKLKPRRKSPQE